MEEGPSLRSCPLCVCATEPGLGRRGSACEMLSEETQHFLGLCFRASSGLRTFPHAGIQAWLLCHPLLTGSKGTSSHGNQCFVQALQMWPCLVTSWLVYSVFLSLLNISCIVLLWLWHKARTDRALLWISSRARGSGQVTFVPWQETAATTSSFHSRSFPVSF